MPSPRGVTVSSGHHWSQWGHLCKMRSKHRSLEKWSMRRRNERNRVLKVKDGELNWIWSIEKTDADPVFSVGFIL